MDYKKLQKGDVISKNINYTDPVYFQIKYIGSGGLLTDKFYKGFLDKEVYLEESSLREWQQEDKIRFKEYRQKRIKEQLEELSNQIYDAEEQLSHLKNNKSKLEKEYNSLFNSVDFILE